jgi:glycosyltransferase involved in cell wall biosynthesis
MDEQTVIRSYGNTNLPEGTPDCPIVTFALFAYNQEQYIREAVEGAFSQTYSPLEIILSDDCSDDSTFEIIEEMARDYNGPHLVRVRRGGANLGVVPHVMSVSTSCMGSIVVVAAGDDISHSSRVTEHVRIYQDNVVYCVTSAFDLIDKAGEVISTNINIPIGARNSKAHFSYFVSTKYEYRVIQGSTASYRREVFNVLLPTEKIIFSEDNLFNFIIYALNKRVIQIPLSLVRYRTHDKALSNRGSRNISVSDFERESLAAAKRDVNKVHTFLWLARQNRATHVNENALLQRLWQAKTVQSWPSLSVMQRTASICRDVCHLQFSMIKWKLARVFGSFPQYQPKVFVTDFLRKCR